MNFISYFLSAGCSLAFSSLMIFGNLQSAVGATVFNLINGGMNAPVWKFRWQALVYVDRAYRCGGALVHSELIVTARHCLKDIEPSRVKVRVGEYDRLQVSGDEQTKDVVDIISVDPDPQRSAEFPDWDDLVLVRMSSPVVYTKRVRPIRLPYPGQKFQQNSICLISGFGRLQESTRTSRILQQARMPVIDSNLCRNMLQRAVYDTHICTYKTGRSACQGDSGGPLSCKVGRRWILAGITAFGSRTCKGLPTVHIRISEFVDFITREISRIESERK